MRQGETLEDGVDLNKYSTGLKTVGVDIMDANGQLKDMDTILHEIGDVWEKLDKNSQVALAQTVAGIRQYNQFMALFDNWGKVEENLAMAAGAEGTLEEQAEIYAESWQAAKNRVKSAMEEIYSNLIDDNFFKNLLNIFADLLNAINGVIDAFGGVYGVLSSLGLLFSKVFEKQILSGMQSLAQNIYNMTPQGKAAQEEMRQQFGQGAATFYNEEDFDNTSRGRAFAMQEQEKNRKKLYEVSKNIRDPQLLENIQNEYALQGAMQERVMALGENADFQSDRLSNKGFKLISEAVDENMKSNTMAAMSSASNITRASFEDLASEIADIEDVEEQKKKVKEYLDSDKGKAVGERARGILEASKNRDYRKLMSENEYRYAVEADAKEAFNAKFEKGDKTPKKNSINEYTRALVDSSKAQTDFDNGLKAAKKSAEEFDQKMNNLPDSLNKTSLNIMNVAQGAMGFSMGLMSLKGAWDALNNPDLSGFEKFLSVTLSLSMALQGFAMVKEAQILTSLKNITVSGLEALANLGVAASIDKENDEIKEQITLRGILSKVQKKNIADDVAEGGANLGKAKSNLNTKNVLKGLITLFQKLPGKLKLAAVAAAALAITFQVLQKNSPDQKIRDLEARLASASDQFGKVKEELANVTGKYSELENLYQALDKCAIGSMEWKENLYKVNQEVLTLISTYPELAKYLDNSAGVLSIQEEGWDKLIDKQTVAADAGAASVMAAQWELSYEKATSRQQRQNFDSLQEDDKGQIYADSVFGSYGWGASYNDTKNFEAIAKALAFDSRMVAFQGEDDDVSAEDSVEFIEKLTGITMTTEELEDAMANYTDELYEWSSKMQEAAIMQEQYKKSMSQMFQDAIMNDDRVKNGNKEEAGGILATKSQSNIKDNLELLPNSRKKLTDLYEDVILGRKMTSDEYDEFKKSLKDDDTKASVEQLLATTMAAMDQTELESITKEGFKGLESTEIQNAQKVVAAINNRNITNEEKALANQFLTDGTLSGVSSEAYNSLDYDKNKSIEYSEIEKFITRAYGDESDPNVDYLGDYGKTYDKMVQEFGNQVMKGWDEEAYENPQEELTNLVVDSDVEADKLKTLTNHYRKYGDTVEGVSEQLKDNYSASQKVAHSLLRFDHALKDLEENGEAWADTLKKIKKNGGAVSVEDVENLEAIENAYGDLLDIDPSTLSEDFIRNAKNLELMKQAANGSEEAYEQLQQIVQQDILAQCDLDTTKFDAEKAKLDTILAEKGFDDLEIGASLKGDGALRAMQDLVNAANMTAEQATSYLASMGVDAEVVADEKTVQTHDATNIIPSISNVPITWSTPVGLGEGSTHTGSVPSISYEAVPVYSERTVGGASLKVTSARKSSGGGFKMKNSSGGSRRGGGGGRRGGGGRGAERRTTSKKVVDTEKERYYTVNNQLEDMRHQLEKISEAKDRAFGEKRLKALDNESKALENLLKKQKEYQQEIRDYYQKDRQKLIDIGLNPQFDVNGTITNYDEIIKNAVDDFNSKIDHYNSLGGSAQESLDKQYKDKIDENTGKVYGSYEGWAQAEFDRIKEAIDQYTETQDLIKDVETEIQDTINQIYDLKLEKIEYNIELKTGYAEESLELLEFLLDRVDDNAFQVAEKIALIDDRMANSLYTLDAYKTGLQELFDAHGLEGSALIQMLENGDLDAVMHALEGQDLTADEVEFIREAKGEILNSLNDIRDSQIEVIELVGEVFDAHMEEFDKLIEQAEFLQDITENYGEIVEIVGRKALGMSTETMKLLNSTAADLAVAQVERSKAKYDEATREYQDALEQRNRALESGDAELIKHWDETCENIREGMQDAQSEFMDAWIAALEKAREEFDNGIQLIIEDFKNAIGGLTGGLDALANQFDLQSKAAENYLPEYERIYELNKLIRDIDNSIDETPNIKAKQALLELEEEVNKAREDGKELSEYDLNYLRKRYELKVAELALKEARDAKSQVRMTKDSEGNFSYVYTADDAAVETAEQAYEDKLFEMQQMNAEYINTMQQSLIDLNNEYADQFEQLSELYEIGSEEYVAALDQLQAWYANQQLFYTSQLEGVINNNTLLYEIEVAKYAEMTNNKAMLDMEYISHFSQIPLAILSGFSEMEQYQMVWQQQAEIMYDQAAISAESFKERQNEAMLAAGTSMEDFSNLMQEEVAAIGEQNDLLTEDMNDTLLEVQDNWDAVIDKVNLFRQEYENTVGRLISLNEQLTKTMNDMLAAWAGVQEEELNQNFEAMKALEEGSSSSSRSSSSSSSSRGRSRSGSKSSSSKSSSSSSSKTQNTAQSNATTPGGGGGKTKTTLSSKIASVARRFYRRITSRRVGKGTKASHYNTGGYTGDWNSSEGRIAVLHQKELVLNQNDTKNFLKTVDIVRQISQTIDLNALSASGGLSKGIHSSSIGNNNQDVLQQEVHITAEFPNATDKQEILNAFDNVINLAAQYANRK